MKGFCWLMEFLFGLGGMTLGLPLARDKEGRGSDHNEEVSAQARFINKSRKEGVDASCA